eukprot:2946780-Rhodomonas_salina.2
MRQCDHRHRSQMTGTHTLSLSRRHARTHLEAGAHTHMPLTPSPTPDTDTITITHTNTITHTKTRMRIQPYLAEQHSSDRLARASSCRRSYPQTTRCRSRVRVWQKSFSGGGKQKQASLRERCQRTTRDATACKTEAVLGEGYVGTQTSVTPQAL